MILTFGEAMLRIAPEGMLRFSQALPGSATLTFGGGEANVAASCLKHSIAGDVNFVSESEVVSLMEGNASGRVRR